MKFKLLMLLTVLLLTACQGNSPSQSANPTSSAAASSAPNIHVQLLPMTDNEYTVLKAVGATQSMIFNIDPLPHAGEIEYLMEHYVDGQLQDDTIQFSSSMSELRTNNKIYFSILRMRSF